MTLFGASFYLYGQNVALRLSSNIGFNSNNLETNTDWNNHENRSKVLGANLEGFYYLRANNKLRPFVGTGIGYQQRSFQYDVKSHMFRYTVNSVSLNQDFISIPLIAGLEYNIYANNSIGMQVSVGHNIATSKNQIINSPEGTTAIFGSLEYDYLFRLRSENHLSKSISLFSNMQLGPQLFLNLMATFTQNNVYGSYDHESSQIQTLTDSTTNGQSQSQSDYTSSNNETYGNFLQFGVGLSKWF